MTSESRNAGPDPPRPVSSRPVRSNQTGPHPRLLERLRRQQARPWTRPPAQHTVEAWWRLRDILAEAPGRPVVLDSGCGAGASAHRLALLHPAAWIVGVDRSASRLRIESGLGRRGDRVVLLRAELGDLWRLMVEGGVRLGAHYLLYPNPWPKKAHLGRRVHGHPAFSSLLALGGRLEARSNWPVYLEELALAIRWVTGASADPRPLRVRQPLTPFERKYLLSGHGLYRLQVCLRPPGAWPDPSEDLRRGLGPHPG